MNLKENNSILHTGNNEPNEGGAYLEILDEEIDRYIHNQIPFKCNGDLLFWWYKNKNIFPIL